MQDAAIVQLYWDRDENAIRETRKQYGPLLSSLSYRILQDLSDAEEVVSDTYLAAWNAMPTDRPTRLSAYLCKICRHRAIDRYREKHSQKRGGSEYSLSLDELADVLPDTNSVEAAVDSRLLGQSIACFLQGRKETERALFIRRYFALESLKEAAENLGISESRAKSMLHRMRQDLRAHLRKEGF